MIDWRERIVRDPDICHGKPCIKGTRIMATIVLDNLAAGSTPDEIIRQYESLTIDDIHATLGYASHLARKQEWRPIRSGLWSRAAPRAPSTDVSS